MRKSMIVTLGAITLMALLTACSTAPKSADERAELRKDANDAIAKFRQTDTEIAHQMDSAYGMAVFPEIAKGGLGVGGAAGQGVVYEGGKAVGYCHMSQATVGLQAGGQTYSEMILFENKAALDRFTKGEWAMAAQATAVAAASGAGTNAKYKDGVMVYVVGQKGLMGEAAIGGQKFKYEPM